MIQKEVLLDLETELGFQGLRGCLMSCLKGTIFTKPWECPLWNYFDQLQEARPTLASYTSPKHFISIPKEHSKIVFWFCFQDIQEITHPEETWVKYR